MTGWISLDSTRHTPEDELHAYLDQALSRSQCVEIECHLAECHRCAQERDRVAAVRDRTTAILAEAAPISSIVAPPLEQLIARHAAKRARRREFVRKTSRYAALAAGVTLALAAGWWSRGRTQLDASRQAVLTQPANAAPQQERTLVAVDVDSADPGPVEAAASAELQVQSTASNTDDGQVEVLQTVAQDPAPLAIQVSTVDGSDELSAFSLPGLWQSVDWYEAWALTGGNLPRIDGLPVVDVQVQRSQGEARPTVVIAQQHPSGRLIRTIEGPYEKVAAFMEGDVVKRVNSSAASFTPPDYLVGHDGAALRGLRIMTVTGNLPADSLNALARTIK